MDLAVAASQDALLESLDFSLPSTSSYVLRRSNVTAFPSGATVYNPGRGVNVTRITLASASDWCDVQSIRIGWRIKNLDTEKQLNFAGGPGTLIERLRLYLGSTLIEDLPYYGRSATLLEHLLNTPDRVANSAIESGMAANHEGSVFEPTREPTFPIQHFYPKIIRRNGGYVDVMHRPVCGITSLTKHLPLWVTPLTFEISWILPDDAVARENQFGVIRSNDATVTEAAQRGVSKNYEISNVILYYSSVVLDSSLTSGYASALKASKSLTFSMTSMSTQLQLLAPGTTEFSLSLTRAVSKLTQIMVTFTFNKANENVVTYDHPSCSFGNPSAIDASGGPIIKQDQLAFLNEPTTLQAQVQIGTLLYPERNIESLAQFYYMLTEACDTYTLGLKTLNISSKRFETNNFVIAMNTSKVPLITSTGCSTRSGDSVTVRVKNLSPALTNLKAYVHFFFAQYVSLSERSVQVMD